MNSIQGQALVASPYLTDPNFLRTVVYILQHDAQGAVGVILNRPTQSKIGEVLPQQADHSILNHQPVYCGGPVEGPLTLLQETPGPEPGTRVMLVTSDPDTLAEICASEAEEVIGRYRVFEGYSGWGAGQLDSELKSGGWLQWRIAPNHIFSEPDELWQTAVHQIGRDILVKGIDPDRIPHDPACN